MYTEYTTDCNEIQKLILNNEVYIVEITQFNLRPISTVIHFSNEQKITIDSIYNQTIKRNLMKMETDDFFIWLKKYLIKNIDKIKNERLYKKSSNII